MVYMRCFFTAFIIVSLFFATFVNAATSSNGLLEDAEQIRSTIDKANEGQFTYLSEQWQEFFLNNTYISIINSRLETLDPLFIIVLAREYSFSLMTFFIFLIWLFTFLWIPRWLYFFQNEWLRYTGAFALSISLAHIQVYHYVALGMVKLLYFRHNAWWSIAIFVFLIVALVLYLFIMRYLSVYIKRAREHNEKRGIETRVKRIETEINAQDSAAES